MRGILIDTNAYGAFKEGRPEAVAILRHAPLIGFSTVVLGELLGGFAAGAREASNREQLLAFLASERVRVYSVDSDTAESYARLYLSLRRKGTPIPTNDLWIAATARQHSLAVFTYDRHFREVEGVTAGNRLEDFSA